MTSSYTGTKWGAASQGTAGGTVSWSFAHTAGSLVSFDASIDSEPFQDAVRLAFDLWRSIADIDFAETADAAGVNIRVGYDLIDGPYNTLAQTSWSYSAGTTHHSEVGFDLAEAWSAPASTTGTDAFAVAVHEIGHALGLGHSDLPSSIMYPYLQGNFAGLGDEDVRAIQQIYGTSPVNGSVLIGTTAAERLVGGSGNDTIYGGSGNDNLIGGAGADEIKSLLKGGESVTVTGGGAVDDPSDSADHIIVSGDGSGIVFGNGGSDHIDYTAHGAGTVYGGFGADSIDVSNDSANAIFGGTVDGDTIIVTGNGDNLVLGGSYITDTADGADRITISGNGHNLVYANAGNDTVVIYGSGNNTVYGGLGDDRIVTGSGSDRLIAGSGANNLTGGAGADLFVHSPGGHDVIDDFHFGEGDRLDLQGQAYHLTTASDGSAVLVFDDGGLIVLHGVSQTDVSGVYLV